ncbi:hypothetical protein DL95DRAFT_414239 [Leptodontidium sp. 2 PMI_412]|nr:hypothetical protein DL95DRAFT_414239 [Leptodontidium sp. 2 PMI_412]
MKRPSIEIAIADIINELWCQPEQKLEDDCTINAGSNRRKVAEFYSEKPKPTRRATIPAQKPELEPPPAFRSRGIEVITQPPLVLRHDLRFRITVPAGLPRNNMKWSPISLRVIVAGRASLTGSPAVITSWFRSTPQALGSFASLLLAGADSIRSWCLTVFQGHSIERKNIVT